MRVKKSENNNILDTASILRKIVPAGNAVVANPIVNEEMRNSLSLVSQRWNDVAGGVLERQRALKAASHHYGEFKGESRLMMWFSEWKEKRLYAPLLLQY